MSTARLVLIWYLAWFIVGGLAATIIFRDDADSFLEFVVIWIAGSGAAVVVSSGLGAIVLVLRDARRRR